MKNQMKNLLYLIPIFFILSCQSPNAPEQQQENLKANQVVFFEIYQVYQNETIVLLSKTIYTTEYFYFTTLDTLHNGYPVTGYYIAGYTSTTIMFDMFEPAWQFKTSESFDEPLFLEPLKTYSLVCIFKD
jgi:hypothetical protein